MTVYHPSACRAPTVERFEEYGQEQDDIESVIPDTDPCSVFGSRTEFEFAELTHEANLSKRQIKRLLKLIDRIASRKDRFSFKTEDDIGRAWNRAKLRYPTVCSYLTLESSHG